MDKLGASTRAQAVAIAFADGRFTGDADSSQPPA
jgi:hypothetical protein